MGDSFVRLPEFQVQGQLVYHSSSGTNAPKLYIAYASTYREPDVFRCLAILATNAGCGFAVVTPDDSGRFDGTFPKESHVVGGSADNPRARDRVVMFRVDGEDRIYRMRLVGQKVTVEKTKAVPYGESFDESFHRYWALRWTRAPEVRVENVRRSPDGDSLSFVMQVDKES